MSQSLFQQIYSIVCQIPPGQAATYGQIALLLGNPRMSRVVGTALSVCRDDAVPCHRVVNRSGGLCDAFSPFLELEGVPFTPDGTVDLTKCRWSGPN